MSPAAPHTAARTVLFDLGLTSDAEYNSLLASLKPIERKTSPSDAPAALPVSGPNPLYDALRGPAELNVHAPPKAATAHTSNLTLTDNCGVTNLTVLSPTLELYNELDSVKKANLKKLLENAWQEDSLLTLKASIIWASRSIPRGKGEREAWTRAMAWLSQAHPQTFLRNLDEIVKPVDKIPQKRKAQDVDDGDEDDGTVQVENSEDMRPLQEQTLTPSTARSHGVFRDLLNLLWLASLKTAKTDSQTEFDVDGDFSRLPGFAFDRKSPYRVKRFRKQTAKTYAIAAELDKPDPVGFNREARPLVQALQATIVRIFGEQLRNDLRALDEHRKLKAEGKYDEARKMSNKISLAAKWAPTENNAHDQHTGITATLAAYLTPPSNGLHTAKSTARALARYRIRYLGPLRAHLEVVERRMSSNEWQEIEYSRVPSLAMNQHKKAFALHDHDGFLAYLTEVSKGAKTISGATLAPGILVKQASRLDKSDVMLEVVEAQWKTLVSSIQDMGTLSSCIAVADVSGSMMVPTLHDRTTPIDSSLGLTILVASVTRAPWSNSVISFSRNPHFIDLPRTSLKDDIEAIQTKGMGLNTDFVKTLRTVLQRAVDAKLALDDMPRLVYVFSDMEFDAAEQRTVDGYATHHEIVKQEFADAGYELPQIVYWNLAARPDTNSKPVTSNDQGVALVSGYSAALIKVFLEGHVGDAADEEWLEVAKDGTDSRVADTKAKIDPVGVMKKALAHESFQGLKVFD
ncbi:hypothetical protein OIV83_004630 [Microbotryomycetes sp. JL201]|nr:hypothetical protein OIV83_004630 [Microbotryomycetes sp. JL201]